MNEALPPPDYIGPYRVIRPVARGGMASVYEVIEPDTGRRLALKLLERRFRGHNRFGREYRALTRLDHPNIVRVYRFGVAENGTPFLTMELLDGVPAQVYAKSRGRPGTPERTREAVRIIGEVARALAYLHSRGIVHRDLKSSNVLVLRDGRVKVLDFGTARLADAAEAITRHGEFVGTYAYAAPEQFHGGGVDARTDLYSLGVLFYRLLTGHRPFDSDDPEELRRLHSHEFPPAPCQRVPGIPSDVGELVMHLLQKEPDARPHSATRVVQALERYTGERPRASALPEPEIAGRAKLIARVREWLSEPSVARGQTLVLGGPSGAGAPRVLAQMQADASGLGWAVLPADVAPVPGIRGLAGVVRAVCRWGSVRSDPELGFVLAATTRNAVSTAPTVETPDRLVRVLVRAIQRRGQPTLFALRGLDVASDEVLRVLQAVCESGVSVAMVGTVSADAPQVRRRLSTHLRHARFELLEPLERSDCYRLVAAVLGVRAPPPRLVERVHLATGGRPGFVVEVVHAMQSEGLAGDDHTVRPVDQSGGKIPLPATVADTLRRQLRALSTRAARVLQVLALVGEPVPMEVIARVLSTTPTDVAMLLAELEQAWLVMPVADGAAWRLPLELLGEVVRASMRSTRRSVLVRSLATALAQASPGPGHIRLLLEAGQLPDASRAVVRWGEATLERGRPDMVAPLVGRVAHAWRSAGTKKNCPAPLLHLQAATWVDLQPGSIRTSEILDAMRRRPDLPAASSAYLLARHLRWKPELERARQQLEQAEELARDTDHTPSMVQIGLAKARDANDAGLFVSADRILQDLASRVRHLAEPSARVRVAAVQAHSLALRGRGEEGLACLALVEPDERWLDARDHYLLAVARGASLGSLGRWSEMLDKVVIPALARVRRMGDPVAHAMLLSEAIVARVSLFQLGEARDLIEESNAAGLRGLPWFRIRRIRYDGLLHELSGSMEGAAVRFRKGADAAARFGMILDEAAARAMLGRTLMHLGREDEARLSLDTARAVLSRCEDGPHQEEVETCCVEALLSSERVNASDLQALMARVGVLARSPSARVRVRVAVAMLQSRRLRAEQRPGVVELGSAALEEMEGKLAGETRAAFRVHPWRVTIERARVVCRPS